MATWPSSLPKPMINGYALNPVDQTIRTEMDVGASRVRRRTTARNDKVSVTWMMVDAQLAAFRTWLEDGATGAAGGAAWFNITLPIGTSGSAAVEARFAGPFKATEVGGANWNVTAELEIR